MDAGTDSTMALACSPRVCILARAGGLELQSSGSCSLDLFVQLILFYYISQTTLQQMNSELFARLGLR